ncbi:MAG: Fe-S cluster assembly protein SufD [Dehalococcoidia bacterium]
MTTAQADTASTLGMQASAQLGASLSDLPRVAALRGQGAALGGALSWPDGRRERPWKYLDVTGYDLEGLRPALDAVTSDIVEVRRSCPVTGEQSALAIVQNSHVALTEVEPDVDGLTLAAFEGASGLAAASIEKHLGTVVAPEKNRFTALHYAFLRGGVLIQVAPNAEVKLPVRIVRGFLSEGQFAAPHTLIVAGANSRVTIVEDFHSSDGEMVVVPAVEIVPGPGAQVTYTAIHHWGAKTKTFLEQRMVSERDSALVATHVVAGGEVVKGHLESSLEGRGSSSELYSAVIGSGSQHVDFYTVQDHIGPDTRSNLLFKSALGGKSRAVYYGLTKVGLGAKNADANQENRNLLLSRQAKADSDPVLEILTSDVVRVSHGATAGPVDREQLYYLQTRGIPAKEAQNLLVRAFLGHAIDHVGSDAIRDELGAVLDSRMAQLA